MKKEIFLKVINILESAFWNNEEHLVKDLTEIYWKKLKKYSDEEIKEVIIRIVDNLKFFPEINTIIEIIELNRKDDTIINEIYTKNILKGKNFRECLIENEKQVKEEFIKLYPIAKRQLHYSKVVDDLFG